MKVDDLTKKVGELTSFGNVNSQNLANLDKKVNELKEIVDELVSEDADDAGGAK
jgi:hypothetical protein